MSNVSIKNEIAKAIVNSSKDTPILPLVNSNINVDLDSMKPKLKKEFWIGKLKISINVR